MGKTTWPKTKAGTIDWEVVFENGETGLIPLISGAGSASALRDSALAVVKLLYTREDDSPEFERLTAELQGLIPNDTPEDALPRMVEGVTAILRQIKDDRIRKAEEYVRHEEMIKDGERRDAANRADKVRKAPGAPGPKKKRKKKARGKKWPVDPRIAGGAAALAVLGMIVFSVATGEEKISTLRVMIDQMKAAVAGEPVKTHAYQGLLRVEARAGRVAVSVFGIPSDACSGAAWYFVNRGNVIINGLMPRRISPNILKKLCDRNPSGATLTWVSKKTVGEAAKKKAG